MSDAIGILRGPVAAGVAPRAPSPAASYTNVNAMSSSDIKPLSPTIHFDPKSGIVITEYFDNEGKVQTQIPSAASVAYRRSGMTHTAATPKGSTLVTSEPPAAVEV
jgi:hypothetical protein